MNRKEAFKALDAVSDVVNATIGLGMYQVARIISSSAVVRATRRGAKKKIDRRSKDVDIVLSIGRPNYAERKAIKAAKKAGQSFPLFRTKLPQSARR